MKAKLVSAALLLAATLCAVMFVGPSKVVAQVVGMFTEVQSLPGDVPGGKRPFRLEALSFAGEGTESTQCLFPLTTIAPAGDFTLETVTLAAELETDEAPDAYLQIGPAVEGQGSATRFDLSVLLSPPFHKLVLPEDAGRSFIRHTGTHALRLHVSTPDEKAALVVFRRGDFRDGRMTLHCAIAGYYSSSLGEAPPK
jgi:hypothetical protein